MGPMWLLLFACSSEAPTESVPAPTPPPAVASLHSHMGKHIEVLSAARTAVIDGDDATARERLTWIAEHETAPELPQAWSSYVDAMRQAASAAAAAEGLEPLAMGVAQVARECGSCHSSMGAGPTFAPVPTRPAEDGTPRDHMTRHNQASLRMWEGLIGGDAERWRSGALALAEQPVLKDLKHPGGGSADAARTLGTRVHGLGAQGIASMEPMAQARLYGQLIGTCASCHAGPPEE